MWLLDKYGDKIAIIENDYHITYYMLHIMCNNLTNNINKRCLVFCLSTNTLGSLVGYVGFLNANIVPLMLRADIDQESLESYISLYKPDYIYLPDNLAYSFIKDNYQICFNALNYNLVKTPFNNAYQLYNNLSLLLTTSGSTGSSKLVRQSYENIAINTNQIIEYLKIDSKECAISTLPMNYTFGLSIINSHLQAGASIVLTQYSIMQKEFWEIMKKYHITSFSGIPYTFEILDKLNFFNFQLPSLKTITQAGGKITEKLHKKFAKWALENNKDFIVMYGQTEASPRMGYLPAKDSINKIGAMGIAIPNGRFEIINENGDIIKDANTIGELVYYGKNVALGYAVNGNDLSKSDEFCGVLHTKDLAKRDEDGFYYIVGRKNRFLKIFGNRVNLDEMERLIKDKFACECACVGVDDKMDIYITSNKIKQKLIDFITKKTGLNAIAFRILEIDILPKNESGKILYANLGKENV
ncbi:hypothetical protein CCY99_08060 [Helicobacter sp. 16-1353]|uniref:AMP-binding protein n=1 Tax=Helicobacter sp. 16-1353 TaxID=2004996 RepID=UPI000DCCBDCF|nr:AMP-binding protein [Helicobacter sp. 16-1353]RAX51903.1 hypothetical protein CCY99_08060 [Helicobacter sp. 16-1353]